MWCLIITYFFFLLSFFKTDCFNLDTSHPVIYADPNPQNNRTFFGYSVLLHPAGNGQEGGITVGSPKSINPTISRSGRPGAVYVCPFMKKCLINATQTQKKSSQQTDEAWIGASMDISSKYDNWAVSGFRWRPSTQFMTGISYWVNLTSGTPFVTIPFQEQRRFVTTSRTIWYGLAEGGFSTHIPNTFEPELILGAPGVFNWGGTAVKVKLVENFQPPVSRSVDGRRKLGRNRANVRIEAYKAAGAIKSNLIQEFDYFGYSLTSGYFYGKSAPIYYVSGSPRAGSYQGKITVFQFREDDEAPIIQRQMQQGYQIGEYFGASLAAGDLNGDGFDDLLVGAPFHQTDVYNEGRVYVFYGGKSLTRRDANLRGTSINGQFGSTIMFLGDIDNDGYGDVAIAAPFEDEKRGALYIYKGSSSILESRPSQKILGRDVFDQLRGFGISISKPADVDNNGYKDIAVGAHFSGHVVILRSYPIVEIKSTLKSDVPTLERTAEKVVFRACSEFAKYTANQNISLSRNFEVESGSGIVHNSYEKTANLTFNLNSGTAICENITIQINNSKSGVLIPIRAKVSYKLIEERKTKNPVQINANTGNALENDTYCSTCPILVDKSTAQIITKTLPYVLKNGEDNECKSTLEVTWHYFGLTNKGTFVLGSQDFVGLNFVIVNRGNKTYNPTLEIVLPESVTLRQRVPNCDTANNESILLCKISESLDANEIRNITLDLNMKKIRNDPIISELILFVKALTCGQNVGANTNTNFAIKLAREADITISGESGEQSYSFGHIFGSNDSTTYEQLNFTQTYKVDKFGVSSIETVLIKINVPFAIQTPKGLINLTMLNRPEGSLRGQPIMCDSNFTFIEKIPEKPTTDTDEIDNTNILEDPTLSERAKREVANSENDLSTNQTKLTVLSNITLYINCSNPMVICSSVVCRAGPFENSQVQAEIRLQMLLNITKELLKLNTTIAFTTEGSVSVISPSNFQQSGQRPDSIEVTSIFISMPTLKSQVALWVIATAGSVGVILLILVTLGLCKAGFFKRTTKEQLKVMKAEAKEEDERIENLMADVEPMAMEPMEIPEDNASSEVLTG